MNKYYPGEPVHIHMKPLINIMKNKNFLITAKKGKCKLPLLCGNEEREISIYTHFDPALINLIFDKYVPDVQVPFPLP